MGTDLTKVTERVRLGRGPGPQGTPPKDSRTLQTDREGGGEGMARGCCLEDLGWSPQPATYSRVEWPVP